MTACVAEMTEEDVRRIVEEMAPTALPGATTAPGLKGEQGEIGPKGDAGVTRSQSKQGIQGKASARGKPGETGPTGLPPLVIRRPPAGPEERPNNQNLEESLSSCFLVVYWDPFTAIGRAESDVRRRDFDDWTNGTEAVVDDVTATKAAQPLPIARVASWCRISPRSDFLTHQPCTVGNRYLRGKHLGHQPPSATVRG